MRAAQLNKFPIAKHHAAFTLVELLVVLSVIGVLMALLLPAIQAARESGRRTTCLNNLHQLGLASHSYEGAHGSLPSLYNGTFLPQPRNGLDEFHFHSWRTALLPQLEQTALWGALDLSLPATDVKNQPAINQELDVAVCPSTANTTAIVLEVMGFNDGKPSVVKIGTAARSDYEVIAGLHVDPGGGTDMSVIRFGAWGEPTYDIDTGKALSYRKARLRDVSDGLSQTVLIAERSGRPDIYNRGEAENPYRDDPSNRGDHHQAAWGISTHIWWLVTKPHLEINETNYPGIYAFHPGGAHVCLADGSAKYLAEATDVSIISAMVTRANADE